MTWKHHIALSRLKSQNHPKSTLPALHFPLQTIRLLVTLWTQAWNSEGHPTNPINLQYRRTWMNFATLTESIPICGAYPACSETHTAVRWSSKYLLPKNQTISYHLENLSPAQNRPSQWSQWYRRAMSYRSPQSTQSRLCPCYVPTSPHVA